MRESTEHVVVHVSHVSNDQPNHARKTQASLATRRSGVAFQAVQCSHQVSNGSRERFDVTAKEHPSHVRKTSRVHCPPHDDKNRAVETPRDRRAKGEAARCVIVAHEVGMHFALYMCHYAGCGVCVCLY